MFCSCNGHLFLLLRSGNRLSGMAGNGKNLSFTHVMKAVIYLKWPSKVVVYLESGGKVLHPLSIHVSRFDIIQFRFVSLECVQRENPLLLSTDHESNFKMSM